MYCSTAVINLIVLWFNKQCMLRDIIPKYAKIKINNNSEVATKVKHFNEKLSIKLKSKILYQKLNI